MRPMMPSVQQGAPAPGTAGPGAGMMGGGMGRVMPGRMSGAPMQPLRRIEGQLAYFRAELRITDTQLPQWSAFAEAFRSQGERLRRATVHSMGGTAGHDTAPEQMDRRITLLSAELEAMRAVSVAAAPLYGVLSEEQRRMADELMAEHLRTMAIGMS